jgi:AcrR family transcriptional regulator
MVSYPEASMSRTPDPDVRERILDAADRLLARRGFRRMTVEGIASEAAIGKGSVYLHFRSKEDVALSCIDRMAAGVAARLEAIAGSRASAPDRLRAMLRARVLERFDYARRHAASLDESLAVMRHGLLERRAAHFADEAALLAGVIAEGARDLPVASPAAAARALITATNALLPYSLSVRELGRRADIARRTEEVVDVLLAGLAAPRRAAAPSHPKPRRPR